MDSRWARFARGWTAAGFATFVAALSHTLAGGAAPSAVAILTTLVIAGAACTLLAGRTLSTGRLAASVGLSQALFHGVFSGLGMPVAVAHEHGTAATMVMAPVHSGATMWLAHAAAALVTIIAFRYAESAFWGLADTATLFLARLCAAAVPLSPAPRPLRVFAAGRFAPRDLSVLLSTMRHRGPPVTMAA